MIVFPTIDLLNGRAVRLYKGDFAKVTDYGDPMKCALSYADDGAKYLHVVDLNAARGDGDNLRTISALVKHTGLITECGGGVRSMDDAARRLDLGVNRVIVGTACVKNKPLVHELLNKYGGRAVALGLDVVGDKVAIDGWREVSNETIQELTAEFEYDGLRSIIVTDISKDGTQSGVDSEYYAELVQKLNVGVVASGGVKDINDINNLKDIGLEGVITGKALFENSLILSEALRVAGGNNGK